MGTRGQWAGRFQGWVGPLALLLAACGGSGAAPQAAGQTNTNTKQKNEPAPAPSATTMDKLAVAAGCVTQGPESPEVIAWRKSQASAVSANLSAAAGCFSKEKQPVYLDVGLESRTPAKTNVWIRGSSVNDCALTQCVADKLRSTLLAPPPAALPSTASRTVQVNLVFDSKQTPTLQLGATPDTPFRDGPCVDHSRLPESGSLSAAHIQSQVRAQAPEQRKCYERGLMRDPNLAGRVEVRFTIALDGSVQTVEIKSNSLPDCQVVGCVSDVFRGLHFDSPRGGPVTVVYPVVFAPFE